MKYGWTPEQLERVNARRAARGQKQLSQGGEYSGQYSRRRKGIEEEDDETQVVSKTPRLDEYKKMLADREKEKAIAKTPRVLSSPYGTQMGSLA